MKPRIDKTGEGSTRKDKEPNPNRMTVPWGRGASEYRPGLFTRQYLEKHSQACVADIYFALSEEIERLNKERIEIGDKPFRRPNYSSFARYFHWFKLLKLVKSTGRREVAEQPYLKERHYYRMTPRGEAEQQAWRNPIKATHPELG